MKRIFICVLLFLFHAIAIAQTAKGKATVIVLNEQKAPVEGATVELLRSKDSALVKTAVSDKSGVAEIENVLPSSYLFRITAIGFAVGYTAWSQSVVKHKVERCSGFTSSV